MFREEVLHYKKNRLDGSIILVQPFLIKQFAVLIALITFTSLVFISIATYTRTSIGEGYLQYKENIVDLVSPKSGMLKSLDVKEGDYIQKGVKIGIIEEHLTIENKVDINEYQTEQLIFQLETLDLILKKNDELESTTIEKLNIEKTSLIDEKSILEHKIEILQKRIDLNRYIIKRIISLSQDGYASKLEINNKEDNLLSLEQELLELHNQLLIIKKYIAVHESEIKIFKNTIFTSKSQFLNKKSELKSKLALSKQNFSTTIHSPASGVVGGISKLAGKNVEKGLKLLSILPNNQELYAVIFVSSSSATHMQAGMTVNLKYSAFPYQRFGIYQGKVVDISKDTVEPDPAYYIQKTRTPLYKITVSIPSQIVHTNNSTIKLKQGMKVSAEIIVEKMSFFEWLFEPIISMKIKAIN